MKKSLLWFLGVMSLLTVFYSLFSNTTPKSHSIPEPVSLIPQEIVQFIEKQPINLPVPHNQYYYQVLRLVNKARSEAGIAPLASNDLLDKAAKAKLDDMLQKNYFAHASPSGITHETFVDTSGYDRYLSGENLAEGYSSASETVKAWLDSPTHKANILNPRYEDTGIAEFGSMVVQIFTSKAKTNEI